MGLCKIYFEGLLKRTCTKVPHLQTKLNIAIFVLQKNAADLLSECYQELVRYVLLKNRAAM